MGNSVKTDTKAQWCGLRIAVNKDGLPSIETLIDCMECIPGVGQISRFVPSDTPFIKIMAPCGEKYVFDLPDDVPLEDIPCRCGNPNHWVMRWTNGGDTT